MGPARFGPANTRRLGLKLLSLSLSLSLMFFIDLQRFCFLLPFLFSGVEFVWEMSISDSDEGFRYWVRWQVPVCALIIGGPAFLAVRFVRNLKAEPLNYNDLWTPCWRNLNPLWLLIFRAFAFVCLAWVLYEIVSVAGAFAFYFYTQ